MVRAVCITCILLEFLVLLIYTQFAITCRCYVTAMCGLSILDVNVAGFVYKFGSSTVMIHNCSILGVFGDFSVIVWDTVFLTALQYCVFVDIVLETGEIVYVDVAV